MATNKVKNLSKKDWQDIAKSYKIEFEQKNAVHYLVEKVAEKIGVDDKIVKLDDLKQAVHDVLTKKGIVDAVTGLLKPKKEPAKKTTVKKDAKKSSAKKPAEKPAEKKSDTEPESVKEESKPDEPVKSKIEQLREQCTALGLAYGSAHTEQDLQNLVNALGGGGATSTPNAPQDRVIEVDSGNAGEIEKKEDADESGVADLSTADKQMEFAIQKGKEQFGDMFEESGINGSYDPMAKEPVYLFLQGSMKNGKGIIFNMMTKQWHTKDKIPNPTPQIAPPAQPPVKSHIPTVVNPVTKADPTEVDAKELQVYRSVFMGAINGHFRAMSKAEIVDILNMENYPFTYSINHNNENSSLIEIILTSKGKSLRLPSENGNQWISISG